MGLIYVLIGLLVVGLGIFVATKFFNKFKDEDKNGIPDVIEDKVVEVKEKVDNTVKEVKVRAKRVKEEVKDVAKAVKEVGKQVKDVTKAASGNGGANRKGRKKSS